MTFCLSKIKDKISAYKMTEYQVVVEQMTLDAMPE
jgi:hypothetical protein